MLSRELGGIESNVSCCGCTGEDIGKIGMYTYSWAGGLEAP
jgi:hypothetical protein